MSDFVLQNIGQESKAIKVLAENAMGKKVNADDMNEINAYVRQLAEDPNPQNRYQIGQIIEYTINKIQPIAMNYLGNVAHVLNINYGDRAVFDYKTEGIKVMTQAKGATPMRSYVAAKRIVIPTTEEISVRPAINLVDLRSGRIEMGKLIEEANRKITNGKTKVVEDTFIASMSTYASPFYGTGTGVVKATLDNMLAYFQRKGPVTILGDRAAIQKVVPLTGFWGQAGTQYVSDNMSDTINATGLIGSYMGCPLVVLDNVYEDQKIKRRFYKSFNSRP